MKFTKNPKANEKIGKQLKDICGVIISEIPDVKSIMLIGGFSRGEGPAKMKNGKMLLYNDYDIEVITENTLNKKKIDDVASKAAEKIGLKGIKYFYSFKKEEQTLNKFFYIDLKCTSINQLKKLMPRLRYYELKNSSLILYGKDYRSLIPDYKLKNIPLSEPAKILLDRMSQMVEYYSAEKKYDGEVLTYIIQQAYAVCCTSLLMLSGKYKPGYEYCMKTFIKRYKKDFPDLHEKIPDLDAKVKKYINWKLNPEKIPENPEKAWFECRNDIFKVSKYFFSKFLNKKIENLDDLSNAIGKMKNKYCLPYMHNFIYNNFGIKSRLLSNIGIFFLPLFFKLKYFLRLKDIKITYPRVFLGKSPDLVIFSSVPYILLAINNNGSADREKMKRGIKILKKVYPARGKNWEQISLDYANAYISFFLQKII